MRSREVDDEWQSFFNDVSIMKHIASDDERVSYMANNVTRRIMSDGSVPFWRRCRPDGSRLFINNFWQSTYVSYFAAFRACADL